MRMLAVVLMVSVCAPAHADVLLNYQGQLMQYIDFGDDMLFWVAVHNEDVSMVFSLYQSATGGTAVWTETQTVWTDYNGVYSVQLGSVEPLALASPGQYWLGVAIDGNAEMTPRLPITPAIVDIIVPMSSFRLTTHSTAPDLCTSTNAGSVLFTSSYTLCYCNGESWRAVGYGSVCKW